MEKEEKLHHLRHSLAHLLSAAVIDLYGDTKNTIGPSIENGFYYDFEFSSSISEKDLPKIEKRMKQILKTWDKFTSEEKTEKEAREYFKNNEYKLELINEIVEKGEKITFYTSGDFTDLCRGGHLENPSEEINTDAFKLDRLAGAYWRGDEKNKMLTRIYGLAFETKEELGAYEEMRIEAKKRDHRKLGKELDLFTFSELVGVGMPLFTPKGNIIREEIIGFSRELNKELGFGEVHTPNINKAELFKISGHYDKYKEDMLSVSSQYVSDEMYLKPMNCPQHTQIYASSPRSYKDLPIRYADFSVLYRDERPGELSGLTRLRSFSQDDGHIFCSEEQIEAEISSLLNSVEKALKSYGIEYWMRLSLRDDNKKEKYLGDDKVWEKSQRIMAKLLKEKNINHKPAEGEAAFYGPKIDIMAIDAIGREWQISTVQLDFNQPKRFELEYIDSDGEKKTPVIIHRALIGSPDRFMGILIEHFAGNLPLWLSPVQVKILPISEEKHGAYAREVFAKLKAESIRVELDDSSESLGKKIRTAKMEKVPYLIVLGDKEKDSEKLTVEGRKEKIEDISVEDLVKRLKLEITEKSL